MAKVKGNKRYESFVKRIEKVSDIKQLKKIIYSRNYYLKKKVKETNPEYEKKKAVMKFPPISDLRIVTQSTFHRLAKIKDKTKLVTELRELIINTTRRKYRPKVAADYSNKEIDYLNNGVESLNAAVEHWGNDVLRMKIQGALKQVTVNDMNNIFQSIPDYWAISEGYYYAITEFDNFVEEIYGLLTKTGVMLTDAEKEEMADRLFKNDPRDHLAEV